MSDLMFYCHMAFSMVLPFNSNAQKRCWCSWCSWQSKIVPESWAIGLLTPKETIACAFLKIIDWFNRGTVVACEGYIKLLYHSYWSSYGSKDTSKIHIASCSLACWKQLTMDFFSISDTVGLEPEGRDERWDEEGCRYPFWSRWGMSRNFECISVDGIFLLMQRKKRR